MSEEKPPNTNLPVPPNPEELRKRNALVRFLDVIDAKFFNTPMLTALITALIAPVVIVQVNQYIQNKAIQQTVISQVLEHTKAEDFSKVQALEKIQVIASFVNENKAIFDLQFDSTLKKIQTLKRTGYTSLRTEIEGNNIKISDLEEELNGDSVKIRTAEGEIDRLERERQMLLTRQKQEQGRTQKQKEELNKKISEKENEIEQRRQQLSRLQGLYEANAKEVASLKQTNLNLEESLKKAQQNLEKLLSEKDQLNLQLTDNKTLLEKETAGNKELTEALRKTNEEWQKAVKDNQLLQTELNTAKLESSKMSKDLAAAQAETIRLQSQLKAILEPPTGGS